MGRLILSLLLCAAMGAGCTGTVTLTPEATEQLSAVVEQALEESVITGTASGQGRDANSTVSFRNPGVGIPTDWNQQVTSRSLLLVLGIGGHTLGFSSEGGEAKILMDDRRELQLGADQQKELEELWSRVKGMATEQKLPARLGGRVIGFSRVYFVASRIGDYALSGLQSNDPEVKAASLAVCHALVSPGGAAYGAVTAEEESFSGQIVLRGKLREKIVQAVAKERQCR